MSEAFVGLPEMDSHIGPDLSPAPPGERRRARSAMASDGRKHARRLDVGRLARNRMSMIRWDRWPEFGAILLLTTMSACTTVDHRAALALGIAGEMATGTMSAQTAAAAGTVARLDQIWGVRETLICAKTRPELRAACLKGVVAAPPPDLSDKIARISIALDRRRKAFNALNTAYTSFIDLSKYNAGAAATAALKTSFDNINAFTSAAAALTPGGPAAAPISTTIEKAAGAGVAIYANHREDTLILAANTDLKTANEAMFQGLSQERTAVDGLLQTLSAEQSGLLRAGYEAGMISVTDVLSPVFQEADPDVKLAPPPPANADVADAAARLVLVERASTQQAAASKSYDDALAALHATVAQHEKLAKGEPLNLGDVESALADLHGDLAAFSPPK